MSIWKKWFGASTKNDTQKSRNNEQLTNKNTRPEETSGADLLERFALDLKKYEREIVRITTHPKNRLPLQDNLDLKTSKFLGIPFFPKDLKYPTDDSGNPMLLIAQLNFAEIPPLEHFPTNGILQLFFSSTDWYEDGFEIVYHPEETLHKESILDFSFLKTETYEEMPIDKPHALEFEKDIDPGGLMDVQFDMLFNELNLWDFMHTLTQEQEDQIHHYFSASGHKLGGYAAFTQDDPRDPNKDELQLLQIDSDNHIMFGDSGIGHIFINKGNLIRRDFSKAYFYWDCS